MKLVDALNNLTKSLRDEAGSTVPVDRDSLGALIDAVDWLVDEWPKDYRNIVRTLPHQDGWFVSENPLALAEHEGPFDTKLEAVFSIIDDKVGSSANSRRHPDLEYLLLSRATPVELAMAAEEALAKGWEPLGGVAVGVTTRLNANEAIFAQAFTRPKRT